MGTVHRDDANAATTIIALRPPSLRSLPHIRLERHNAGSRTELGRGRVFVTYAQSRKTMNNGKQQGATHTRMPRTGDRRRHGKCYVERKTQATDWRVKATRRLAQLPHPTSIPQPKYRPA